MATISEQHDVISMWAQQKEVTYKANMPSDCGAGGEEGASAGGFRTLAISCQENLELQTCPGAVQ